MLQNIPEGAEGHGKPFSLQAILDPIRFVYGEEIHRFLPEKQTKPIHLRAYAQTWFMVESS